MTVSRWAPYEPGRDDGADAPGGMTDRPWEVRRATTHDVEAVAAISIAREGDGDAAVEISRIRRALPRPDALLLVAEAMDPTDLEPPGADREARSVAGHGIIGYARAGLVDPSRPPGMRGVPPGWYLLGVVVVDAWRRRGVGLALTIERLRWLADRTEVVYYVVNAANRPSLDLHARLGFEALTVDFDWPGMTFEGGRGLISALDLRAGPHRLGYPERP